MAADQVLAETCARENRIILRLFRWQPWTLSLGKHQSLDGVNLDKCLEREIMVVRRLTGGRAVLHAQELTYSICVPCDSAPAGHHHDIALKVGKALCYGLQSLGADVEWVKSGRNRTGIKQPLCFASVTRGEILWCGKKVIGSAQRLLDSSPLQSRGEQKGGHLNRTVILQHGSILLDDSHQQIVELWDDSNTMNLDSLKSHTATLKDILGTIPDDSILIPAIINGFRYYFSDMNEEEFSDEELCKIKKHANDFFLGGWNLETMGMPAHCDSYIM
jgi:lipoate-protein ligase A